MIRYDSYRMFSTGEVMAPLFQGQDDSEEFPVIYVVVSFGGSEGGGVVSTGV